ncbi:MAG: HD domain-containing protein [Armatimonadetes bacterium]|nr:HD domain-containing protein [Armatimonadota bacterium]
MEKEKIIQQTKQFVKNALMNDFSGHDWEHTRRVWILSKKIATNEGGNTLIIELAALLHDIADWKFNNEDLNAGPKEARKWLSKLGLSNEIIVEVCEILVKMAFKGTNVNDDIDLSLEGKIVQDADRLDAMGAIGIARTFAFGGYKHRPIYDPKIDPKMHNSFTEYANCNSPTINHFYEKLLILKQRMNTNYAKEIAKKRHEFMEEFLQEFFKEYNE